MSEDPMTYGTPGVRTNELRELAAALGFSQREVGRQLEVDERTVRYWFAANPAPPLSAIYAMRYLALTRLGLADVDALKTLGWVPGAGDRVLTPTDIAEANRIGGHAAIDELVRRHLGEGSDVALVQTPRGTI